jgi:hypothetical protein
MTTPKVGHIFRLAQIIQESCEHCTDQEATSLAKAILEHPGSRWCPQQTPEPEGVTDKDLETTARAAENQYMKEHGGLTAPTPDRIHALLQKQRLAGLRAIAARYARPPIEPVPKQEDIHYAWELHEARLKRG